MLFVKIFSRYVATCGVKILFSVAACGVEIKVQRILQIYYATNNRFFTGKYSRVGKVFFIQL
jgi:hypothetical protein